MLGFFNGTNVRIRRSAFEFAPKPDDCVSLAFGDSFDRTIRHIPHGSNDSKPARGSNCEIAKADALNPASNYEPPGDDHTQLDPRPERDG